MTQSDGSAPSGGHGRAIENEVRQVAARLGLADFVYRAELVDRGAGSREPGDALIYANSLGGIVQVKSRDPAKAMSDSASKVQQWIDKHGAKAADQAAGTRRQLVRSQQSGSPVLALPVRASHLPIDSQRQAGLVIDMPPDSWPSIVVIDHPLAKGCSAPLPPETFWITLDDWASLHEAIRSTTGVLTYIQRVLESDPTPRWTLGTELFRYAEFVKADRSAAVAGGSTAGFFDWSVVDRPVGVELYRDILRRVWPEGGELPAVAIDDYRLVIEHLDAVPPGQAADLGEWIFRKRQHLGRAKSWASGFSVDAERVLVYACDHHQNYDHLQQFDAALMALTATRCSELVDSGRPVSQACGVGVIQGDGWLDYRFAFMKPPLHIPPDVRYSVQQMRGEFDASTLSVRPVRRVGRNELCPCGSGQKYKRCHGVA